MPLDPKLWRQRVSDDAAFLRGVYSFYLPLVPWKYSGADIDFSRDVGGVRVALWTECLSGFKKYFCQKLAEFINLVLMKCITDTNGSAFQVADKILNDAGLQRAKGPTGYVRQKFDAAAGFGKPPGVLATELETYWH